MDLFTFSARVRSDSTSSSTASQGSRSKMLLRQRLNQLMTCIEDMSSDDEASEEVCRSLDEAFQLCGRFLPTDTFRLTQARLLRRMCYNAGHCHTHTHTHTFIAS